MTCPELHAVGPRTHMPAVVDADAGVLVWGLATADLDTTHSTVGARDTRVDGPAVERIDPDKIAAERRASSNGSTANGRHFSSSAPD